MIGRQVMKWLHSTFAVILFVAGMMLVLGCDSGQPVGKKTFEVRGQVLLDDVPLAEARITFVPMAAIDSSNQDLQPMSYGLTDADGKYELRQADGTLGAVKGQHAVMISKPIVVDQAEGAIESGIAATDSLGDMVPEFYRQHGYLMRHVMPMAGGERMDFKLSTIDPLLK